MEYTYNKYISTKLSSFCSSALADCVLGVWKGGRYAITDFAKDILHSGKAHHIRISILGSLRLLLIQHARLGLTNKQHDRKPKRRLYISAKNAQPEFDLFYIYSFFAFTFIAWHCVSTVFYFAGGDAFSVIVVSSWYRGSVTIPPSCCCS